MTVEQNQPATIPCVSLPHRQAWAMRSRCTGRSICSKALNWVCSCWRRVLSARCSFTPAHRSSRSVPSSAVRLVFMGLAMGATAIAIILSPMGRRSGAHFNPIVSFTFFLSGQNASPGRPVLCRRAVCRRSSRRTWRRGFCLVHISPLLRCATLSQFPATTVPPAFLAEFFMGLLTMTVVLQSGNRAGLSRFTWLAGWPVGDDVCNRVLTRVWLQSQSSPHHIVGDLCRGVDRDVALSFRPVTGHAARRDALRSYFRIGSRSLRQDLSRPSQSLPFSLPLPAAGTIDNRLLCCRDACKPNSGGKSWHNSHYDIIIIGTGAGGATLAHRLAPSGMKILILERGDYVPREKANWSSLEVNLKGHYLAKEKWRTKDGEVLEPHTNYNVGGNTKFFGAALFRLREGDFGEIRHHGGVSPAWPINYKDLEPYYAEAEDLFEVRGERGVDPTEPPTTALSVSGYFA